MSVKRRIKGDKNLYRGSALMLSFITVYSSLLVSFSLLGPSMQSSAAWSCPVFKQLNVVGNYGNQANDDKC